MELLQSKAYFNVPDFENLREMLYRTVKRYPNEPAFMFKENIKAPIQTITYGEYAEQIEAVGSALWAEGFAGKRFAIIGENSYPWCLCHMSVICGLGVSVPLDKLLPENEVEELLQRSKPAVMFFGKAFLPMMLNLRAKLPFIEKFVCMDALLDEPIENFSSLAELLVDGRKVLVAGNRAYLDSVIDREALSSLLFTSGTTSMSKAVMLSHKNLCAEVSGLARVVHWKPGTRVLSLLPLHHTFENTCGFLMMMFYGGTVCQCNGLRYIQQNMVDYKIDMIVGVPLIFESFYKKIQESIKKQGKEETIAKALKITRALRKVKIDVRRLIFKDIIKAFGGNFAHGICGAAPIDPAIITFFDDIGVKVLQGYGMTETSPVSCGCNHRVFLSGSVGHAIADTEVAVDNENPGEEGELLVRGDIVMQGYLNDDGSIDRSSFTEDGWLRTGDIAAIGENGCIFITGRIKSMIVLPNGKKVFPEELEYLINRSGLVQDSMVWGEHEGNDILVSAKFVLNPDDYTNEQGEPLPPTTIREQLDKLVADVNAALPSFKTIRYYVYSFQDMVRTTTKKVKRHVEQELIKETLAEKNKKLRELTGKNIDELNTGDKQIKSVH